MWFPSCVRCAVGCATPVVWFLLLTPAQTALAAAMGNTSLRPFVIAWDPVIGRNGAVGGVTIDVRGVLDRAAVDARGKLREVRGTRLPKLGEELTRNSGFRKVSLRGLATVIEDCRQHGAALPIEALCLAGLQRVKYVLHYPEQQDIVLAGFAEGWRVGPTGDLVGETTGQPVLQLDDLLVALRTAKAAAAEPGLTCSIDPTEEGLARFQKLIAVGQLHMNRGTITRLEKTLGPSVITVTGVEPDTHFAQVMVAADLLMKRLAMDFESSPTNDLPSYMQLLRDSDQPLPDVPLFRVWLAPRYDSVLKSPDGLAWELSGPGVQTLTEDSVVLRDRRVADAGKSHAAVREWAERFTENYEGLTKAYPVFAQLRNCIDLAVAAAIVAQEGWLTRSDHALAPFLDSQQVDPGHYRAAKLTPTRASYVQRGDQYVVSLSGGVDLDSWGVLRRVATRPTLAAVRTSGARAPPDHGGGTDVSLSAATSRSA